MQHRVVLSAFRRRPRPAIDQPDDVAREVVALIDADPRELRWLVLHLIRAYRTVMAFRHVEQARCFVGGQGPSVIVSTVRDITSAIERFGEMCEPSHAPPLLVLLADPGEGSAVVRTGGLRVHALVDRPVDGGRVRELVRGALEARRSHVAAGQRAGRLT